MGKATAVAHPNIAFVKYWGRIDEDLNLPANPSLSMNLAALTTVTTVEFQSALTGEVAQRLRNLAGVQDVLVSGPGGGARLVAEHLF